MMETKEKLFKAFLKKHGLEEISTGGSCTALEKETSKTSRFLIMSDTTDGIAPTSLNEGVFIQFENNNATIQITLDKLKNLKSLEEYG
jgi:hypothetical protein